MGKESPKERHQFEDWDVVDLENNYSFALKEKKRKKKKKKGTYFSLNLILIQRCPYVLKNYKSGLVGYFKKASLFYIREVGKIHKIEHIRRIYIRGW